LFLSQPKDAEPASATYLLFFQRRTSGYSVIRGGSTPPLISPSFAKYTPKDAPTYHSLTRRDLLIPKNKTCLLFRTGPAPFGHRTIRFFAFPSIKRLGSTHDAFRFDPVGPPADLVHDAFPCGNLPPPGSHRPRKRIFSREALLLSAPDPRPLPSLQDRCAFPSRARHA
jgi:hypothetical protein